jgi:hypothetical protein
MLGLSLEKQPARLARTRSGILDARRIFPSEYGMGLGL